MKTDIPNLETTTTIEEKPKEETLTVTPQAAPVSAPKRSHGFLWATGRRKTAVAQVRFVFKKNSGKISINRKSVADYFKGNSWQEAVAVQSLELVKTNKDFDVFVKVSGGGITGQAEAVRYGIARALIQWDPKLKPQLRKAGYLTRDPRMVERKKPGQPKARKRFQYSKR